MQGKKRRQRDRKRRRRRLPIALQFAPVNKKELQHRFMAEKKRLRMENKQYRQSRQKEKKENKLKAVDKKAVVEKTVVEKTVERKNDYFEDWTPIEVLPQPAVTFSFFRWLWRY